MTSQQPTKETTTMTTPNNTPNSEDTNSANNVKPKKIQWDSNRKDRNKFLKLTFLEWFLILFVGLVVTFFYIHGNVFEAIPRLLMQALTWILYKVLSIYMQWEANNILHLWQDSINGISGK